MNGTMPEQILAAIEPMLGRRVRNLQVSQCQGRIVLRGDAFDYYTKQLAQHFVAKLFEVIELDNEIRVEGRTPFVE